MICRGLGKSLWRGRAVLTLGLLAALSVALLGFGNPPTQFKPSAAVAANPFSLHSNPVVSNPGNPNIRLAYGQLPMIFEANQGQTDPKVKYLARGSGYGLFLAADEAVLALRSSVPRSKSPTQDQSSVLQMQMVGANPGVAVTGDLQLPGRSNYFIGNDPSRWHRDIPQFSRVRYAQIYPGVDLVYYGNQGRLEYDFEVAPGADPRQIVLRFGGSERLSLQKGGDLLISLSGGDVQLFAPRVYRESSGRQQPISARFVLRENQEVAFELGAYDSNLPLVIDPVLGYSSYLGGTRDEGCSAITGSGLPTAGCPGVAVDSASSIYLAGTTTSLDFPVTSAFQTCLDTPPPNPTNCPNNVNLSDIFVTKLDSTGSTILFSTYLGGSDVELSAGIAVDSGLNVDVTGSTKSGDFPVTPNAFQLTPSNVGQHVFVTQLKPTGDTLLYSTYLSGNGKESAFGVAVDFRNKIYVVGTTTSTDVPTGTTSFPATLAGFQTCSAVDQPPAAAQCGTNRFFLSKVDPVQSGFFSLPYSTYFAGGNPNNGLTLGGGITTDTAANVYITGTTNYLRTGNALTDFPVQNAYQGCLNTPPPVPGVTQTCTSTATNTDAFVAKFNLSAPSGAQLLYSTYLGGTTDDVGNGVSVDTGFTAYVTGSTTSTDFIIPAGTTPFQSAFGGQVDAYLAKFGNPCTGSTCTDLSVPLAYFTYLGGSGTDVGLAIAVDSTQNSIGGARITGYTNSDNFPLNPIVGVPIIQANRAGGTDAFVSRIDTTASTATGSGNYGTYLGGAANDFGTAIATDGPGNTYVAGETASHNFPTKNPLPPNGGGLQGNTDAFISKLTPSAALIFSPPPSVSPFPVGVGNPVNFEFSIINNGDLIQTFTVIDTLPATGATFNSASASPGTCTNTVVNLTVQCILGPLNAGQSAEVTVKLNPVAPNPPSPTSVQLTDSAQILLGNNPSIAATATVNDYNLSLSPSAPPPVVAGAPATLNVTVTPTGNIPQSVSLSCTSRLPAGALCQFPNGSSIPNLSSGAQSRELVISTTARVTTPASLWRSGKTFYAAIVPLLGFALLGMAVGSKTNQRRGFLALFLTASFSLILFQAACSSSSTSTTTTGTPAGTYSITVSATSGSAPAQAARTQQLTLTVQ